MNRPTCPPSKPYTNEEILKNFVQHFVIDKSPQSRGKTYCSYSGTGCGIGCMIDIETATIWDPEGDIFNVYSYRNNTFSKYFSGDQMDLLQTLQIIHDKWQTHDGNFADYIVEKLKECGFAEYLPEEYR